MKSVLLALLMAGCAIDTSPADPNAGLFRDFVDGKFDSAGHPLNSRVTEAETLCPAAGSVHDGALRLAKACTGDLPGAAQSGTLVVSARIRVKAHAASGSVVTIAVAQGSEILATDTLTVARMRNATWIDLPLTWSTQKRSPVELRITPAAGAAIDVDYVEVFPQRFGLVLSPGSGVVADDARLTFELPRSHHVEKLTADGADITDRLAMLIDSGAAKRTTTTFRTLVDVGVRDLLPARGDVTDLRVNAGPDAARLELRATPPACNYEGTGDTKVLVTGFQPFPADASHENVAAVAVQSIDPSALRGARVMRIVMPVEYDRAAAEVTDAIARCEPDIVISFGQGGDAIALEEVAYNLQDTGEVSGGVPDNRGIVRAAVPIDPGAPATRDTLLPLDAIEAALVAIGEAPQHSRDPGRYICNNVMFADLGAMAGKRAGFIHLPYTTEFDAATRARFGGIAQAAIQAVVDQK